MPNLLTTRPLRTLSPLLKWYLDHSLIVTQVYQVIEFSPMSCFKQFHDKVSDARRAGDVHEDQSIIADTMKLIGNWIWFYDYGSGKTSKSHLCERG